MAARAVFRDDQGEKQQYWRQQMTKILLISCSPRGRASESYRLAQRIVGFLLKMDPAATLATRMISDGSIGHVDEYYAISQGSSSDLHQGDSIVHSEELIRELESSDFVVIGTPLHNFTVPSSLKAWIDHVVRVRRTFDVTSDGKIGILRNRPVFVAVSSGGNIVGSRARQPDFLTPYLKAVLGTIGLVDVTFFYIQKTSFGPDAVATARIAADRALRDHFSSPSSTRPRPQMHQPIEVSHDQN